MRQKIKNDRRINIHREEFAIWHWFANFENEH